MIQLKNKEALRLRKEHIFVMISLVCLILPMVVVLSPVAVDKTGGTDPSSDLVEVPSVAAEREPGPLLSNILQNPSFETRDQYNRPTGFGYYGTARSGVNTTYQDTVHSSPYAARIWGQGSTGGAAYPYAYYSSFGGAANLTESLTLDFYWYIEEAGAIDQSSACYLYIETYNESSPGNFWYNYRSMNYVFCHDSWTPNNGSTGVYFYMNDSYTQWNHFSRNLTLDFIDYFGYLDSTRRITSLYFYAMVQSPINDVTSWVIDDVSMINSTPYEYIMNGDFDAGYIGYWNPYNSGPSEVQASVDSTLGQYSLNLSCATEVDNANSYVQFYRSLSYPSESQFPTQYPLIVEFDWKYDDTWNSGGARAYFRLRMRNNGGSNYYIYFYLGRDDNTHPYSNSSNSIYIESSDFSTRNSWMHASIDISAIAEELSWVGLTAYQYYFYLYAGTYANSTVELLVDDFQVLTYPSGDPGFEVTDWDTGSVPLGTWYHWNGDSSTNLRTNDAHSGSYAANLTVANSQHGGIYRYNVWTPIDPSMTTDFWWKLTSISSGTTSVFYSRLRLEFDWLYYLCVYSAKSDNHNPSNSSSELFIYPGTTNTTGTWINTKLNISAILVDAFGLGTYNLTRVIIETYAGSGEHLTCLYDDILFADMTGPVISSVSTSPVTPVYHSPTAISATATDAAGVWKVKLYYRVDGGPYSSIEMSRFGALFSASIPAQTYGSLVEYYVNATDWTGQSSLDTDPSYSFTVDDDISPTITLTDIEEDDIVSRLVLLNATAEDVASGIDYVEFRVDGSIIGQDDTSPYQYLMNTWILSNGSHTVAAEVFDNEGNSASDSVVVNVQNDVAPPVITNVVVNPSVPQYDQVTHIYVGVSDANELLNVTIHYRLNGGAWASGLMLQETDSLFSWSTTLDWDTEYEYYIVAYDSTYNHLAQSYGNATHPLGFVVGDSVKPDLSVLGPSPLVSVRELVQFYASATDAGSGIASIRLSIYQGDQIDIIDSGSGVLEWDTLEYANGNYTLQFVAVDNAGNLASFTVEYQVHNPEGFEVVGDSFSDFMASYGFFVGAASTIGILIIGKIVMNRRAVSSGAKVKSKKK